MVGEPGVGKPEKSNLDWLVHEEASLNAPNQGIKPLLLAMLSLKYVGRRLRRQKLSPMLEITPALDLSLASTNFAGSFLFLIFFTPFSTLSYPYR